MKKPISICAVRPNDTHWTFMEYSINYDANTGQVGFDYLNHAATECNIDITKVLPTLNRLHAIAPNMKIIFESGSNGELEVTQSSSVAAPPDAIAAAFELHKLKEGRPKRTTKSLQQMSVEEFTQFKKDEAVITQYQSRLVRKEAAFIALLKEVVSNECQRIYKEFHNETL